MDFRHLTTFRVLAATLNFHQAAERLNYVQSTVTAQIQALEEELGTRLFDRIGKRVISWSLLLIPSCNSLAFHPSI